MRLITLIFLNAIFFCTNCQVKKDNGKDIVLSRPLNFIGYQNQNPLFIGENNSVFELKIENDLQYSLMKLRDSSELKEKWLIYFNNDLEVYGKEQGLTLFNGTNRYDILIERRYLGSGFRTGFLVYKNLLFCALNSSNDLNEEFDGDFLRYVNLDSVTDSAKVLPFKASKIQIVKDWLYYSESILNDDGTITNSNIYRVKLLNWELKELVIRKNSSDAWFVDPENSDRIFARIFINKKHRDIILDIPSKKFAELQIVDSEKLKNLDQCFWIPRLSNVFFIERTGAKNEQTLLTPFPEMPEKFPFEYK